MKTALALLALAAIWTVPPAHAQQTLDAVRKAGTLTCGVVLDEDDYSEDDTHGNLAALGGEYCRALAAIVLGDAGKARFLTLHDEPGGLAATRDGKVDVLFGATPNPLIGNVYGLRFGPPIFFDGQGFLVSNASGIARLADLSHRNVCYINNAPAEQILYDALEPRLKEPEARFPYSERGEMEAALSGGHCDAITGDVSWLANVHAAFHARIADFTLLPETISIDPFAPAYRAGDPQWAALVDWTVWVLLQAEEHGVTQANAGSAGTAVAVKRLTGATPWIGKALDVTGDAFRHAIEAVGNAGEIYERTVGAGSPLRLPRGRNVPASQGGLLWALPVEPLE